MERRTSSSSLFGTWSHESLRALFARHLAKPMLPALGSPAWEAAARSALGQKFAPEIRALADAECGQPLPELTDALYAEFHRNGVRLPFEDVYFARRMRLGRAAVALVLCGADDPGRPRILASFLEKLEGVLSEVSWALPAHVGSDTGKDPRCIDLFAAETANLFAEMLEVFGQVIPPDLEARIRERLGEDIFENYLENDFRWLRMTNNWNAVCHQGVIGSALATADDPDLLARMLLRARDALPVFLSGFTRDGGCSEGPDYWQYGFGWFALLNERLEHRTCGELSLFADDEQVRALARYGPAVSLSNGQLVNFSDCKPSGRLNPALLAYLGERLDDDVCRAATFINYHDLLQRGADWSEKRTDFLHVSRWLLRFPDPLPSTWLPTPDCFFPDLGVLVVRGTDAGGHLWEFAAKAGHNAEHHNHNDCGSFLVNVDGRRILAEVGAPEYVRDTFNSAKRYGFLAARSLGHSVPLVNGCEQAHGERHAATVLACEQAPERAEFSMDLAACYPEEADCRRLVRSFIFEKSLGRLALRDEFLLDAPAQTASVLICLDEPTENGDSLALRASAGLEFVVTPSAGTRYFGAERCEYRDRAGCDAHVYRLTFAPESPAASGSVELVFTLRPAPVG